MPNHRRMNHTTWARNTFWRIWLKLQNTFGVRVCKLVEDKDGDAMWVPVKNHEMSDMLLRSHGVDPDGLERERKKFMRGESYSKENVLQMK